MTTVVDRDVRAMLRITRRYGDDGSATLLPYELLLDLRRLVRCEFLTIYVQDTPGRTSFGHLELPEVPEVGDIDDEAYWAHYWDSLDCSYPDRTGDLAAVTMISDFYSVRAQHSTAMYSEYDGPAGVEREIRVCLPAGPGRTLRLLWCRGRGPDFSERDRDVLTLLRPHLHAAYLSAERRRQGTAQLTGRQREVLGYVAAGHTNGQIAARLRVSEGTVRKHLENVYERLGVTNRVAAVARFDPHAPAS